MMAYTIEPDVMSEIAENKTLSMFRTASKHDNYHLLKQLPSTVTELKEKAQVTKMPFYRRLNQLESEGLIYWKRNSNHIKRTELGDFVIEEIDNWIEDITGKVNDGLMDKEFIEKKMLPELIRRTISDKMK